MATQTKRAPVGYRFSELVNGKTIKGGVYYAYTHRKGALRYRRSMVKDLPAGHTFTNLTPIYRRLAKHT